MKRQPRSNRVDREFRYGAGTDLRHKRRTTMPQVIDRNQVQELMTHGAQLVEVLPPNQYKQMHLAGASNLPLGKLDQITAAELEKDKPVIVYCYDYQ
jgi:rhodanese-related sulfurtransferase